MALPEDVKVELIDGVFYDMASPSLAHQDISAEIGGAFRDHIKKNGGGWRDLER